MAGVFDDDAARIGDTGFDYACVGVNVGDINVSDEDERGDANLVEARKGIGRGAREVGMV